MGQEWFTLGKKKIYCHVKNELVPVTFVNLIFTNFAWNDDIKSLFLHCRDELNELGPSWMVLTHGNVIFDILDHPAFQKYSICWVFQTFFCSTFFTCILHSTKSIANRSESYSKIASVINMEILNFGLWNCSPQGHSMQRQSHPGPFKKRNLKDQCKHFTSSIVRRVTSKSFSSLNKHIYI